MLENDLFEMLPEFSNVGHILAVIQNVNDHSVRSAAQGGNNVSVTSQLLTLN